MARADHLPSDWAITEHVVAIRKGPNAAYTFYFGADSKSAADRQCRNARKTYHAAKVFTKSEWNRRK